MAGAEDTVLQSLHSWHGVGGVSTAHTPFLGLCLWRAGVGSAGTWPGAGALGWDSSDAATRPLLCWALLGSAGLCSLCAHPRDTGWSGKMGQSCCFAVKIGVSVMFFWHLLSCWWASLTNRHVPDPEPLLEVQPLSSWQLFAAFPVHFNRLIVAFEEHYPNRKAHTEWVLHPCQAGNCVAGLLWDPSQHSFHVGQH